MSWSLKFEDTCSRKVLLSKEIVSRHGEPQLPTTSQNFWCWFIGKGGQTDHFYFYGLSICSIWVEVVNTASGYTQHFKDGDCRWCWGGQGCWLKWQVKP